MKQIHYPRLKETVYEARLANGLQILIAPRPGFTKKYAIFATDFGSMDTSFLWNGAPIRTPDGIAHYLEHKMFDMPEGDALQRFAATGANANAYTNYDRTAYLFECTERFEENLRILLEFVSTPYFTAESVAKEQGIIGQEISMCADNPYNRLLDNLYEALFVHHPAQVPILGTVESIAQITAETLTLCHNAFYHPANMVLCVAGDVDPAQIVALAEEILPQASQALPPRDHGPAEPLTPKQPRITGQMEVSMPTFVVAFKTALPPYGEAAQVQHLLGDLAAEVLAGESSPLYNRLYAQHLIDNSFGVGYDSIRGAAMLSLGGDSENPDAVLAAILEEAARIAREGVDEALFARLKKSALGRWMRALDSFSAVCEHMAGSYFDGYRFQCFPEVFAQLTAQQVADFIREVVVPERACISIIYPQKEAAPC